MNRSFLILLFVCFTASQTTAQLALTEWQTLLEQQRYSKTLHEVEKALPSLKSKKEQAIGYYWQGKAYLAIEDWQAARQSFTLGLGRWKKSLLNQAATNVLHGLCSTVKRICNLLVSPVRPIGIGFQ